MDLCSYTRRYQLHVWISQLTSEYNFRKLRYQQTSRRSPVDKKFLLPRKDIPYSGLGWRSRHSDSLRTGRSGDRIPVGVRFSAPVQTGPGAYPASCTMGTGSFLGVKSSRGVTLTPHPLLVPQSKKGKSYTSTPTMGHTACTEPQSLYKGALYLFIRPSDDYNKN